MYGSINATFPLLRTQVRMPQTLSTPLKNRMCVNIYFANQVTKITQFPWGIEPPFWFWRDGTWGLHAWWQISESCFSWVKLGTPRRKCLRQPCRAAQSACEAQAAGVWFGSWLRRLRITERKLITYNGQHYILTNLQTKSCSQSLPWETKLPVCGKSAPWKKMSRLGTTTSQWSERSWWSRELLSFWR